MDNSDGYIIVGAGSTGSSIAYNLSLLGKKVTLIDMDGIASGNTGKSSALVRTQYSNSLLARMAVYSLNVFKNFNGLGYSGFTKTGMFFIYDKKHSELAKGNEDMLESLGINEREVDIEFIKKFYPEFNGKESDFIIYEPESGYADPVATTNSFVNKAKELGCTVLLRNRVISVESGMDRVSVVLNNGLKINGSKVILATNMWTNQLLENSGILKENLYPIHPSMHGIIYFRRPEPLIGIKPTILDMANLAYYKMEGETIALLGSMDPELDRASVDLNSYMDDEQWDNFIDKNVGIMMDRLPSMQDAKIISKAYGFYDMTPDGQAIIEEVPDLKSVYVCAGLSGHGFKLSPAYGKIVSEMVTGVDPDNSTFDWRIFSSKRFKTGEIIRTKYSDIGTIY
jgi:sarcosine oxidase subunit beta